MPGTNEQQVFVLDKDSMVRLWLTDQVDSRRMTQLQADVFWQQHRNKANFAAEYFAVGTDVALLTKLGRDLRHPLGRVYFKTYGGKPFIIFKGHPGLRKVLTGTRYGVQNAKVVSMGLGRAGVMKSAKGGTIVTCFLLTGYHIADYFLRDGATLGQLLGAIAGDVTKAAIGGAVGAAVGAALVGTVVGTFALGPLIVAVGISVGVGLALNWLDDRYGLTAKLQVHLDRAIADFERRVEQGRQNLLERGARAAGVLVDELVDLAVGAAVNEARRRLTPLLWRFVPRL
jgi:hypothetical protein